MEFRKLGIIEPIVKVIEEERFEEPSDIQVKTIPLVVEGKDVIAGSATGSGTSFYRPSRIACGYNSGTLCYRASRDQSGSSVAVASSSSSFSFCGACSLASSNCSSLFVFPSIV